MISKIAAKIGESATLAITAKAKQMKKKGEDIIVFGAGEPDFDTPYNIKEAAIKAITEGFTKYTPVSGIIELKQAICDKLKRDNNLEYSPENIIVSCGGKHALYNIMLATLNKGDEVIVPNPYWGSYIEQIKLADAKPVLVRTDENFKLKADNIKGKVTAKTRLLIVNTPSNPTGAVVSREELEKIAELAVNENILVISDEVYEKFVYEGEFCSIASLNENIKKLTVTVNAVSKAYSMTGWRIGYAAAEKGLIDAMGNIQSQTTSNPTSVAQKAALEALTGPQESIGIMIKAFRERRDFIVQKLNEINGIKCHMPEGAFYVFPDVSALYKDKIKDSLSFSTELLDKVKVAVIPGSAFGNDKCIRLSYACSMDNISKGVERIKQFCESI